MRDCVKSYFCNRALFLDRDGVINVDHGYVHRSDDFDFIDGIFDLARSAHTHHYKLVVITNQAGIGRGLYSEKQFHDLTAWMCLQFAEQGAPIEKVYFSPFHPTEGKGIYKKDDYSRKPHPGMIQQAQAELELDLMHSVLIGDKDTDIQAGITAGVGHNILFAPVPSLETPAIPHYIISRLCDALPFLHDIPVEPAK